MEVEDNGDIKNNTRLSDLLSWMGDGVLYTGRTFWETQGLQVPDGSVSFSSDHPLCLATQ